MPDETTAENVVTAPTALEMVYDELEQTQSALQEIDMLITKNAAELERLAQRNAQVSNYVRQFQTHLDAVPSEVICEGYEALLNTRQRLVALRGRLDKLESDRRNLERLAETQRRLLQIAADQQQPASASPAGPIEQPDIRRIILDEEAVRERIAGKLHAGPIRSLSNLVLQAEICQRLFDANPERTRAELATLRSGATAAFSTIKSAVFEVRPMTLNEVGIIPAVMRYVEALQEANTAEIKLSIIGEERRLPGHVEALTFRGIQELLNDARTCRQATQIWLTLEMAADKLSATVEDDGVGVAGGPALSATGDRGGLKTLQERIELMGGAFQLQGSSGRGARAGFSLPVERAVNDDLKSPIHEIDRK